MGGISGAYYTSERMASAAASEALTRAHSQAFYNNARTDVITTLETLPDSTVKVALPMWSAVD